MNNKGRAKRSKRKLKKKLNKNLAEEKILHAAKAIKTLRIESLVKNQKILKLTLRS